MPTFTLVAILVLSFVPSPAKALTIAADLTIGGLSFAPGLVAPEPATLIYVGTGAAVLLMRRSRRRGRRDRRTPPPAISR